MTLEKALNVIRRIIVSKNHHLNDINEQAYNTAASYILNQRSKKNSIPERDLAFKLYVICLGHHLKKWNTSVYDKIAIKEFHKLIHKPSEFHVIQFLDDLITYDQSTLLRRMNISSMHPLQKSKIINDKENEVFMNAMENPNNKNTLFGKSWSFKQVSEKLNYQFLNINNNTINN